MWRWMLLILVFVLILVSSAVLILVPAPRATVAPANATSTPASLYDVIVVATPLPGAKIASPIAIQGEARGSWFFEASAPTQLLNAGGTVIAQGHATALSNWMTQDYVPFTATLTFPPQPAGSAGTLVLKNDNPSGNPATQKELDIPVKF